MKKGITLGQVFSIAVSLVIVIITGVIVINKQVSANDERIKTIRERQDRADAWMNRIEAKIDKSTEQNSRDNKEILIQLQNKQNRK